MCKKCSYLIMLLINLVYKLDDEVLVVCVRVRACVCVREREREGGRKEGGERRLMFWGVVLHPLTFTCIVGS